MYTWRLNGFIALRFCGYTKHMCVMPDAERTQFQVVEWIWASGTNDIVESLTWHGDGQPNSVRAWQRTSKGSCPALRLTQLEAMNPIRHVELLYLYIDTVWGVPCFHAFSRFIHFFHLFSRPMNKEKSTFSTGRSAQAEVLQKIQDDPKTEPRHNVAPDPQIPWFSSLHSLRSSFHKLGIRAVLNGVFQMHTTDLCSHLLSQSTASCWHRNSATLDGSSKQFQRP